MNEIRIIDTSSVEIGRELQLTGALAPSASGCTANDFCYIYLTLEYIMRWKDTSCYKGCMSVEYLHLQSCTCLCM